MRKNPQRGRACASSRIQRRSAVRSCARLVRYRAARLNGASLQDRTQLTWKVAGNQPARGAVRASRIVKFRFRVAEWADDEPAAHVDTDSPLKSSATRCGSIIASRSASETWRTCWPPGVSKSPMKPSGNGVGGSGRCCMKDLLRVGRLARPSRFRRSHTTGMKSKVHPTYKTKYRVANWPAYNQALVRGVVA